jgi:hypothetical protein
MINLFGKTVKCAVVLLEYTEDRSLEDFDLSVPFTPQLIDDTIQTNYPDLVEKSKELFAADPNSGVMLDHFLNEVVQPAFVSLLPPKQFLDIFGITAPNLPEERYYASVLYTARDNELRFVYRNDSDVNQTDVVDSTNVLLFHETMFTGELPPELNWALQKEAELNAANIPAKISHYKVAGGSAPKVYFKVRYEQ